MNGAARPGGVRWISPTATSIWLAAILSIGTSSAACPRAERDGQGASRANTRRRGFGQPFSTQEAAGEARSAGGPAPGASRAIPSPRQRAKVDRPQTAERKTPPQQAEGGNLIKDSTGGSGPRRNLPDEVKQAFGNPTLCFERADWRPGDETAVTLNLRVTVTTQGRVSRASVSGTGLSRELRRCLQRQAEHIMLRAPVPKAPRTLETELTFDIQRS